MSEDKRKGLVESLEEGATREVNKKLEGEGNGLGEFRKETNYNAPLGVVER